MDAVLCSSNLDIFDKQNKQATCGGKTSPLKGVRIFICKEEYVGISMKLTQC